MPITAVQKERRQQHLGSSDMAAVLGLDVHRTSYDVWAEKTGKLVPETKEPEWFTSGKYFEDGVLQHAEDTLGKLVRNQYRSAKDRGIPLGSNIDALLVATGEPIEAKTGGLFGPLTEPWGDAGTDEVPERVIIQAHVHMICTQTLLCHVPAFLGGRGFLMFAVPWEPTIADVVTETSVAFWNNHVLKDIPPDDSLPTAKVIKKFRRLPDSVVDIDYSLVETWLNSKAVVKEAEGVKEAAEIAMLTALGQSEGGACTQGLLSYLEQTRTTVDGKALKAEYPDVYEQFARTSAFRVPRFKVHK